ncbi:alpha/beta-hydrolase, partial [Aureobasidium melanogenum]
MSTDTNKITIPRPGVEVSSPVDSIPGPSEEAFTTTFGELLPAAQYLSTAYGKIAYYTYAPKATSTSATSPSASGQKVLFLHGVQTPALGLQPLATSLHAQFPSAEFVLVDLWGHGLSSTPLAPHTPSLFHYQISTLLSHLAWESCHLIGYSFGGITAISYLSSAASSKPTKITSISLVAPAGLWKSPHLDEEKLYNSNFNISTTHVLELLEGGPLVVPSDWQDRVRRGEIVAEKSPSSGMEVYLGKKKPSKKLQR